MLAHLRQMQYKTKTCHLTFRAIQRTEQEAKSSEKGLACSSILPAQLLILFHKSHVML